MRTILVIDDEPRIVEVLENFLVLQGFRVKKAYDGREGLGIVKREHPIDLIILDEKMPGLGGATFRREMKKLKKNIPYIVLTGSIGLANADKAKRKAYKYLLYKPVRLSELLRLINEILGVG